jgi:hypothetical protein
MRKSNGSGDWSARRHARDSESERGAMSASLRIPYEHGMPFSYLYDVEITGGCVAEQLSSTLEPLTRLVTCADSAAQHILPCSST